MNQSITHNNPPNLLIINLIGGGITYCQSTDSQYLKRILHICFPQKVRVVFLLATFFLCATYGVSATNTPIEILIGGCCQNWDSIFFLPNQGMNVIFLGLASFFLLRPTLCISIFFVIVALFVCFYRIHYNDIQRCGDFYEINNWNVYDKECDIWKTLIYSKLIEFEHYSSSTHKKKRFAQK